MMGPDRPNVALRPMLPADAAALAAIYVSSIEELTGEDYDINQQSAWAARGDDPEEFGRELQGWLTLVATIEGEPAGFGSLKGTGQIEMLYVHPAAVGQGVASVLCDALERLAAARKAALVTVDASDTAQGFFAKRGYQARIRKTLQLGEEWLGTTAMEKSLVASPALKTH